MPLYFKCTPLNARSFSLLSLCTFLCSFVLQLFLCTFFVKSVVHIQSNPFFYYLLYFLVFIFIISFSFYFSLFLSFFEFRFFCNFLLYVLFLVIFLYPVFRTSASVPIPLCSYSFLSSILFPLYTLPLFVGVPRSLHPFYPSLYLLFSFPFIHLFISIPLPPPIHCFIILSPSISTFIYTLLLSPFATLLPVTA